MHCDTASGADMRPRQLICSLVSVCSSGVLLSRLAVTVRLSAAATTALGTWQCSAAAVAFASAFARESTFDVDHV